MPIMDDEVHCSFKMAFAFVTLAIVRGSTPLIMLYGVFYLRSPALVVALKCAVSLFFFVLSLLFLLRRSSVRSVIFSNITMKSTYWKLLVVGLLQSAAPYLLSVYAVQFVPITFNTVFMVTTPWWVFLFERFSRERKKKQTPFLLKGGMVFGFLGIMIMMIPIAIETANCNINQNNRTDSSTVSSNMNSSRISTSLNSSRISTSLNSSRVSSDAQEHSKHFGFDYCHPLPDIVSGFISCLLAPILWAIAAVFWKKQRGDIHHVVSSIGQNLIGGIIASLVWLTVGMVTTFNPINWNEKRWVGYILYLGVATGCIGTLLVRYLYTKRGPKSINQVLTGIPVITFIEDWLFIRDMVTQHSYTLFVELFGLIMVTAGVFISNVRRYDTAVTSAGPESRTKGTTERLLGATSDYHTQCTDDETSVTLQHQVEQYERHVDYAVYNDNVNGDNTVYNDIGNEDCGDYTAYNENSNIINHSVKPRKGKDAYTTY